MQKSKSEEVHIHTQKSKQKFILNFFVLGNLLKSAPSAIKAISSGELRVLRDFAKVWLLSQQFWRLTFRFSICKRVKFLFQSGDGSICTQDNYSLWYWWASCHRDINNSQTLPKALRSNAYGWPYLILKTTVNYALVSLWQKLYLDQLRKENLKQY